jgi:hypothetical protein
METNSVKRISGSPQASCEFEDTNAPSSTCEQDSTGPVVAMVACNVILLLMLAA